MASEWQRALAPQFGNPAFLHPVEFPCDTTAAPMAAELPHIYEEVGPPDLPPTLPPSSRSWGQPPRFPGGSEFLHFLPDDSHVARAHTISAPTHGGVDCGSGGGFRETPTCRAHCQRRTTLGTFALGRGAADSFPQGDSFEQDRQAASFALGAPATVGMYPGLPMAPGHVCGHGCPDVVCADMSCAGLSVMPGHGCGRGCVDMLHAQGSPGDQSALKQSVRSSIGDSVACCTRASLGSSVAQGTAPAVAQKKRFSGSLSPFALLSKSSRDSTSSILKRMRCRNGCSKLRDLPRKPWIIGSAVALLVVLVISAAVGLSITYLVKQASPTTTTILGTLQILGGTCSAYIPLLSVRSSSIFSECATSFVNQLDAVYRRSNASGFYNYSEVLRFRSGSVIVDFRLHVNQPISSAGQGERVVPWLAAILRTAASGGDSSFVSSYAVNISSIVLEPETSSGGSSKEIVSVTDSWLPESASSTHRPSLPPYAIPPQSPSRTCVPITAPQCQKMAWNTSGTTFPNFIDGSQEASEAQLLILSLLFDRCYSHFDVFVCSVYTPKCGRDGARLPPCRRLCEEAMARCGAWMDAIHTTVPVDCSFYPNATDPEVCVDQMAPVSTCPIGTFMCDNRTCLKQRNRCDGIKDCVDGSDEQHCAGFECTADQFKCANGRCRPLLWQCDGFDDCGDKSDEANCQPDGPCAANMFHCKKNGTSVWDSSTPCIKSSFTCDGNMDCTDKSDEDQDFCRGRLRGSGK